MPDRLQQEIEELLAQLDTLPPRRSRWSRFRDWLGRGFSGIGGLFSRPPPAPPPPPPPPPAGHVLLVAIALIVVAYLAGGKSDLARWVIVAGVVLFIAAFILSLRRQSRPPEKLWRGQPMDLRPGRGH